MCIKDTSFEIKNDLFEFVETDENMLCNLNTFKNDLEKKYTEGELFLSRTDSVYSELSKRVVDEDKKFYQELLDFLINLSLKRLTIGSSSYLNGHFRCGFEKDGPIKYAIGDDEEGDIGVYVTFEDGYGICLVCKTDSISYKEAVDFEEIHYEVFLKYLRVRKKLKNSFLEVIKGFVEEQFQIDRRVEVRKESIRLLKEF